MKAFTKADEKALFQETIQHTPEGYVKDILLSIQPDVEWAINADFGFIDLAGRIREIEEHRAEMFAATAKLASLKDEIRQLEAKRDMLDSGIRQLRSSIAKFSAL